MKISTTEAERERERERERVEGPFGELTLAKKNDHYRYQEHIEKHEGRIKVSSDLRRIQTSFRFKYKGIQVTVLGDEDSLKTEILTEFDKNQRMIEKAIIKVSLLETTLRADFIGFPARHIFGSSLLHELGHLEDMLRRGNFSYKETMEAETRAWIYASDGTVESALPQPLRGTPKNAIYADMQLSLASYEKGLF